VANNALSIESSPLVSVVIPTYNRANLVVETVESVIAQTYPNVEIVVVDDGSTDDTVDTLGPYRGRVKLVRQPNAGRSVARNTGMHHTSGKYIVFLDSDDLLLPESLAVRVTFLEAHPEVDLVYGDGFALEESGRLFELGSHIRRFPPTNHDEFVHEFCKTNFFPPLLALVRRSTLVDRESFDPEIVGLEDWDLWLRMLFRGASFAYLDEKVAVYRRHSGNTDRTEPASFVRARTLTCTKIVREDLDRAMSARNRRDFRLEHIGAIVRGGSPRMLLRALHTVLFEGGKFSPYGMAALTFRVANLLARKVRETAADHGIPQVFRTHAP
jgi:glycosyltransferase involved in cell wall biosynthesis